MFSLFGRKGKAEPRRVREGMPVRVPETTVRGPASLDNLETRREMARRTAEKIDRIESEMIAGAGHAPATAPLTNPAPATMPMRPSGGPRDVRPNAAPAPSPRFGVGTYAEAEGAVAGPKEAEQAQPEGQEPLPPLEFGTSVVLGDTYAGFGTIEVSTSSLPAELEEAAILFANAQPQAAAATLRVAIAQGQLQKWTRMGWLMLLDVLQSCGERADFESVAIDYAARFEHSPPPWQESLSDAAAARPSATTATVRFAARLDASSLKQVDQARRGGVNGKTVVLDCAAVTGFDHDGARLMCSLIDEFAANGRELVVLGTQQLLDVTRASIEAGRRDPADGGWKLALACLRLLGEKEAFDELSIDYCVTYEVSPPSWEPMPANMRTALPGGRRGNGAAKEDSGSPGTWRTDGGTFALRGEIAGRMTAELAALHAYAEDRSDVVIDCRRLRRIDFVAAGELLNEVVVLAGQGRSVLFAEPSSIVEALLVVMGMHELADIRRRKL